MRSSHIKIALIGEVDSGKSTTLGQILLQTNSVLPSKIIDAQNASKKQNKDFEPAFLLDAIEYERLQEMTVDITTTTCKIDNLHISFLDTPGHQHLTSKFIGGAADVDLAVLILDAENQPTENQFRHLQMLRKIGLHNFAILINKLDGAKAESHFKDYVESIKNLIDSFSDEVFYLAPVDSKKGLGFSAQDYAWFSGPSFFDFIKINMAAKPINTNFFCTYRKQTNNSYWLSCHSGNLKKNAIYYVGQQLVNSIVNLQQEPFSIEESPWIDHGYIVSEKPIPNSGFICEQQNASSFQNQFVSDLVCFESFEEGEYLFKSFWSSTSCTISKLPNSSLFLVKLHSPVQLYNLNNRYNLFSLHKNLKTVAIGIPQLQV